MYHRFNEFKISINEYIKWMFSRKHVELIQDANIELFIDPAKNFEK